MTPCEFHLMHYVVIFCSLTAEGILLFLLYYFEVENSSYVQTGHKQDWGQVQAMVLRYRYMYLEVGQVQVQVQVLEFSITPWSYISH